MHSVSQMKVYRSSSVNTLSRVKTFNVGLIKFDQFDFIRDFQAPSHHGLKRELNIH